MKQLILVLIFLIPRTSLAEELRVKVREIPAEAVLMPESRELIPSIIYQVQGGELIFKGRKGDIDFLRTSVEQRTLMPFFRDAFQKLTPVDYTITFQIKDPMYLIDQSSGLSCRPSEKRVAQCHPLRFYTSPGCRLKGEIKSELEKALKVTSSLEASKKLLVFTDNPCINPKLETLYDFALKDLSRRYSSGDFDGAIEIDYQAYIVAEQPLELL